MEEQLVTHKTAKLAKEKGFDIETDKYWCNYYTGEPFTKWKLLPKEDVSIIHWMEWAAPTQSLLQKWLREEHYITVNTIPHWATKVNQYRLGIVFMDKGMVDTKILRTGDEFNTIQQWDSYEEALEKGLQEALKLI